MRARGWLAAGGLALLLLAAGAVGALAPSDAQREQPFFVAAPVGERAEGRNLSVTVHELRLADEVSDTSWTSGEGSLWLVVDLGAENVSIDRTLGWASLHVGDLTYRASDRPRSSTMNGSALTTGIPTRGALVFELPPEIVDAPEADAAELRLAIDSADNRLDSILVTPVDLTSVPRDASIELERPVWGRG